MKIPVGWNLPFTSAAPASRPPAPASPSVDAGPSDQVSFTSKHALTLSDGTRLALPEEGPFLMGRSREAQIRLDGDLVSRNHCQGEFRNGQLWLRDLSSTGTFVDGRALPKDEWKEIRSGSQIGFGQSAHTWQLESASDLLAPEGWQGPDGQSFQWPQGQSMIKVGRAEDSHLRCQDSLVSGNHALMRKVEDRLMVLDTRSLNGTFVDGEKIPAMVWTEVPAGTALAFGDPERSWKL